MRTKLFLIILMIFSLSSFTQEITYCTSDDIQVATTIRNTIKAKVANGTVDAYLADIPVVVHVIHNGEPYGQGANVADEDIYKLIAILNNYYRLNGDPLDVNNPWLNDLDPDGLDSKIQFHLADIDTACNNTTGIYRVDGSSVANYSTSGVIWDNSTNDNEEDVKNLSKMAPDKYLNIWIVNKITPESTLGFAYLAPSFGYDYFGIVIRSDNLYGAIIHEMGHVFGLTHDDMGIGGFTQEYSYNILRNSLDNYLFPLLDSIVCTPPVTNDLRLISTGGKLDVFRCKNSNPMSVVVKNMGSDVINTFTLKVESGGILQTSFVWNGTLNTHQTDTFSPPFTLSAGNHEITTYIENPNNTSDLVLGNDTVYSSLFVIPFNGTYPYLQDFEGTGYQTEFLFHNEQSSFSSVISTYGTNGSAGLVLQGTSNIINYPDPGYYTVSAPFNAHLINPTYVSTVATCIDATSLSNFAVSFDYQQSNVYSHTNTLFVRANGEYLTQPYWCNHGKYESGRDTLDLSNFAGQNEVILTFQGITENEKDYGGTDNGDYIVLDDIRIHNNIAKPVTAALSISAHYGCPGLKIEVQDLTDGSPAPIDFAWIFEGIKEYHGKLIPATLTYYNEGSYDITVVVNDAYGNQDSITYKDIVVIGPQQVSKIKEDIDTAFTWTFDTYGSGFEPFKVNDTVGGYALSSKSLFYDGRSQLGGWYKNSNFINSPPYDFTNYNKTYMKFDISYAPKFNFWGDTLKVEYSTDCGINWSTLYSKWEGDLATINEAGYPGETNLFIPSTAEEWRTDSIDLSMLNGATSVNLRFNLKPRYGNALYLDNIQVYYSDSGGGTSSLQKEIQMQLVTKIYPNPTSSVVNISFEFETDNSVIYLKIYDMSGRLVMNESLTNPNTESLSISHLNEGLYNILIQTGEDVYSKKLIIAR